MEKALVKYIFLAELGFEVAQSNAAYILDQCKKLHQNLPGVFDFEISSNPVYFYNFSSDQVVHPVRLA